MRMDKIIRITGIIGVLVGIIIIIYGFYLHADAAYLNIFYKSHALLTKSEIALIKPGLYYGKMYMIIGFVLVIAFAITIAISFKFSKLNKNKA